MDLFTVFGYLCGIVIIVFIYIIKFILNLDCDLTLKFMERFGKPLSSFKGKVIWISGASSGIGEELAYLFSENGAKLVLSADQDVTHVKEKCIRNGCPPQDIFIIPPFDIRDILKHEKCVNDVLQHYNKIDILVNNVGRTQRSKFEDIPHEIDQEIFSINVFGPINLSRCILKHFLKNKRGHFAVTSSATGKFGAPLSATYTATKHALHGYFESIRNEYTALGISVSMLCPGPIKTTLINRAYKSQFFANDSDESDSKNDKRMTVSRCAYLMAIAIVNELDESWISIQPILWLFYAAQYFPSLFRFFMSYLATPERTMKLRYCETSK